MMAKSLSTLIKEVKDPTGPPRFHPMPSVSIMTDIYNRLFRYLGFGLNCALSPAMPFCLKAHCWIGSFERGFHAKLLRLSPQKFPG